jgi:hypothetical protein
VRHDSIKVSGSILVALAAAALVLAGCGGSKAVTVALTTATTPTTTEATTEAENRPPRPEEPCGVQEVGEGVRLAFSGARTQRFCTEVVRKWSGGGAFWTTSEAMAPPNPTQICGLMLGSGSATSSVVVWQRGPSGNGIAICGRLAHAGWRSIYGGGVR